MKRFLVCFAVACFGLAAMGCNEKPPPATEEAVKETQQSVDQMMSQMEGMGAMPDKSGDPPPIPGGSGDAGKSSTEEPAKEK